MSGYLNLILRLVIWFLLTANLSVANITIGVCVALLLPHSQIAIGASRDWLRVLWEIIVAIPQAYLEAFELILRPHTQEKIVMERVKPRRSLGLIFLDIFVITFTPKTSAYPLSRIIVGRVYELIIKDEYRTYAEIINVEVQNPVS